MSHYHERAWAEANGTDLRDFAPPPPPVCQAEADWIAGERSADLARINRVVASRMADDKADKRARCTVNHADRVKEAASQLYAAMGRARTDGFTTPHATEIAELMTRTVNSLREQKEQAA